MTLKYDVLQNDVMGAHSYSFATETDKANLYTSTLLEFDSFWGSGNLFRGPGTLKINSVFWTIWVSISTISTLVKMNQMSKFYSLLNLTLFRDLITLK